jgi:hypothetical protein
LQSRDYFIIPGVAMNIAVFLLFASFVVCPASSNLLETMGSGNSTTTIQSSGGAQIYTPGSGFFSPAAGAYDDLARPSVPILDLPPLPSVYNNTGVSYPQYYNQSNYLYNHYGYNYNMQPYPYMAYNATGANRNMGYLNTNQRTATPKTSFDGARLLHSHAKIDQEVEGKVSRENFLKAWIQFAGVTQSPPAIARNEVCAFLTSKDAAQSRVIQNVELAEKNGNKVIMVEYKKENKAAGSFYSDPQNEDKKGYISCAIFKDTDHKIEFVDISESSSTDTTADDTNRDEEFFLDNGILMLSLKDPRIVEDRNSLGVLNYEILSDNDLVRLRKLNYDENSNFEKILRDIDFEREVLYVTGRIFPTETVARRLATRRIVAVSDLTCGRAIRHRVIVREEERSKESLTLDTEDEEEAKELRFRGHFVKVDRPRNTSDSCPPQWAARSTTVANHVENLE